MHTNRTPYLDSPPDNTNDLTDPSKDEQQRKHPWYYPISEFFDHVYMQFLLVTTLYVMEPWERFLMITIFLLVISLVSYSAFVYIPYHIHYMIRSSIPSLTEVLMN